MNHKFADFAYSFITSFSALQIGLDIFRAIAISLGVMLTKEFVKWAKKKANAGSTTKGKNV